MWVIFEKGWHEDYPEGIQFAGVFKRHSDAQEYLSFLKNARSTHSYELRRIPTKGYPLLFVWMDSPCPNPFICFEHRLMNPYKLAEFLWSLEKEKDDDHQYLLLTIFHKDYRAYEKGDEEYPQLPNHDHFDNRHIIRLIYRGLSRLLSRWDCNSVMDDDYREGHYQCQNCHKRRDGILSTNGYQPPLGWKIVSFENSYASVCSEKCRKELTEYEAFVLNLKNES